MVNLFPPILYWRGSDRYPPQVCRKILVDYEKRQIRCSLYLRDELQTPTQRIGNMTTPKNKARVLWVNFDNPNIYLFGEEGGDGHPDQS